jgi:pre-mRNA cleavage complex 2 protein Pcf11
LSTDIKGDGGADGHRPLNAKAAAAAEVAKRDAQLRAQYVIVPPGDEAKPISCPICKEILKSEFLEDEEEWVWKNAVKKDDRVRVLLQLRRHGSSPIYKVYHATCHAEATASTSSLAARLRNEIAQRSRSGTPEAHSSRSTPPRHSSGASHLKLELRRSRSPPSEPTLAGTKRKIENDTSLSDEVDNTPPLKRMLIST